MNLLKEIISVSPENKTKLLNAFSSLIDEIKQDIADNNE